MDGKPAGSRFFVVLDVAPLDDPSDPEGWRRLRRFLKGVLRQYGLKCGGVTLATPRTGRANRPRNA